MKISNLSPSEGHRQIIGYKCDLCGATESGEDFPENWLKSHENYFCIDCQDVCIGCFELFSLRYSVEYFKEGFCENCQDKYLPDYKENLLK